MAELDLVALLGRLGEVEQVGSSVSGLMVWRDIEIGVRCRDLSRGRARNALRPPLVIPRVIAVDFHDETGDRSAAGPPSDQRFSYVVRYEPDGGGVWRLDRSPWLSDAPRNQLAHLDEIRRRLTDETGLAILWIKDFWHRLPVYPYDVGGVYDAVFQHGARTTDEFDAYLRERGLPVR